MLISLSDAPYAVEVQSSKVYGSVPDAPHYWAGARFLDMLLPVPRPATAPPAVIFLHGGAWRVGDKSAAMYPWVSPLLAANGFVGVNVGYRLTDSAPFPAQLYDVKAAVRWLRANAERYGIDPDRIGVWGPSAGGHLAALLGTTGQEPELDGDCGSPEESSAVQAVVAICAPTDFTIEPPEQDFAEEAVDDVLTALFGGPLAERKELRRLASPIAHVGAGMPPFLVVHGTHDEVVPFRQATAFVDALREHGGDATLRVIDGGHHNLMPTDEKPSGDDMWTAIGREALSFFTKTLRG